MAFIIFLLLFINFLVLSVRVQAQRTKHFGLNINIFRFTQFNKLTKFVLVFVFLVFVKLIFQTFHPRKVSNSIFVKIMSLKALKSFILFELRGF